MGDHPIPFIGFVVVLFVGIVCLVVGTDIAYSRVEKQCAQTGRVALTQTVSITCEVKKWTP